MSNKNNNSFEANTRRHHIRANVSRPVIVMLPSGNKVRAELINISGGGAAFYYPAPADTGTKIKLRFQLPVKGELHDITIDGISRHSHLREGGFVTGIEFNDIAEDTLSKINSFVKYKEEHCAGIGRTVVGS